MSRPADYYDDKPYPMWAGLIPWLRGQRAEPADADQCRIAADTIEAMDDRIRIMELEAAEGRRCMAQDAKHIERLEDATIRLRAALQVIADGRCSVPETTARKALEEP